jgi:hypothetical protein
MLINGPGQAGVGGVTGNDPRDLIDAAQAPVVSRHECLVREQGPF